MLVLQEAVSGWDARPPVELVVFLLVPRHALVARARLVAVRAVGEWPLDELQPGQAAFRVLVHCPSSVVSVALTVTSTVAVTVSLVVLAVVVVASVVVVAAAVVVAVSVVVTVAACV